MDYKLLHIFTQPCWHDTAYIIGTRESITVLRDACDRLLANTKSSTEELEPITSDGEGFTLNVTLLDEDWQSERWLKLAFPYTDEIAEERRTDCLAPYQLVKELKDKG